MLNVELADQPIARLQGASLSERLKVIQMIDRVATNPDDCDLERLGSLKPDQYRINFRDYRIVFMMDARTLRVLLIEDLSIETETL